MNIYHVRRTDQDPDEVYHDTFSDFIAVAENAFKAGMMLPGHLTSFGMGQDPNDTWCASNEAEVRLLGISIEDRPRVVISVYHAG